MRKGIPVLGIEPAENVAKVAVEKGIPTLVKFFGEETGSPVRSVRTGRRPTSICRERTLLAQVPRHRRLRRGGLRALLLARDGVITIELPHLARLMEGNQFDTIYHEHFSYFSLYAAEKVFADHGLAVFDVEELPTHGGSLRVYACHAGNPGRPGTDRLRQLRSAEEPAGVAQLESYRHFADRSRRQSATCSSS